MLSARVVALSVLASVLSVGAFTSTASADVLDRVQVKVGVSGVLPEESAKISVIGGDVDISDEYVPSL